MAIYNLVKFDGFSDRKWILYRHPVTEVMNDSRLRVRPKQLGIIVYRGKAEKIFTEGEYVFNTNNFPFLYSYSTRSHSEVKLAVTVYFFNQELDLAMLWGTKDPIIRSTANNVKTEIKARGRYKISIIDFNLVLNLLYSKVSNNNLMEYYNLAMYLREIILDIFKIVTTDFTLNNEKRLKELSAYKTELSKKCIDELNKDTLRFGLRVDEFEIIAVEVEGVASEETYKEVVVEEVKEDVDSVSTNTNNNTFEKIEKTEEVREKVDFKSFTEKNKSFDDFKKTEFVKTEEIKFTSKVSNDQEECPRCGKLNDNSPYCRYCGSPMKLRCPLCNNEVKKEDENCSKCGTKLNR